MSTTAAMPAVDPPSPAVRSPRARSETELLRALARGDRAAGAELVDRTYPRVWGALMRLCGGDRELAADLTQETYRRAWAAIATFDGRAAFATWLYRIAQTTFLNHVRRPRRMVALEPGVAETVVAGDAEDAAERVLRGQESERVRRAVLSLPESLRDTVAARYWGGVSARELARAEAISEQAVRKRLRKAYRLLAAALEVTP